MPRESDSDDSDSDDTSDFDFTATFAALNLTETKRPGASGGHLYNLRSRSPQAQSPPETNCRTLRSITRAQRATHQVASPETKREQTSISSRASSRTSQRSPPSAASSLLNSIDESQSLVPRSSPPSKAKRDVTKSEGTAKTRGASQSQTIQCTYMKSPKLNQPPDRCRNFVSIDWAFHKPQSDSSEEEDEEDLREPEVYCGTHRKCILRDNGFWSYKVTPGKRIEYKDFIHAYLPERTRVLLIKTMGDQLSEADRPGYIYVLELMDLKDSSDFIYLKVGRSVNPGNRITQHERNLSPIKVSPRFIYPSNKDAPKQSPMRGRRSTSDERAAWCHRLERLIHLELQGLLESLAYMDPKWSSGMQGSIEGGQRYKRGVVKLRDVCSEFKKDYREVYRFPRIKSGKNKGREWENVFQPVIEWWGSFVNNYVE